MNRILELEAQVNALREHVHTLAGVLHGLRLLILMTEEKRVETIKRLRDAGEI